MQNEYSQNFAKIAVVIIGRNEGKRLADCFDSLLNQTNKIIYVDSGSTDDSVKLAHQLGIKVVSLDMSLPFTAARARNLGFKRLRDLYPEAVFVQFLDGDCKVASGWLESAINFLESHSNVAVVCGRRREMYPEKSIYNQLCDVEWDTPIGQTKACGGDALMRVQPIAAIDGYKEDLIAGEEPELCVRLRKAGWLIWRLDTDMTFHDAAMTRFSQWWKRTVRAGYAFANGSYLHGAAPECHWVAETRRARLWGLLIPAIIFVSSLVKPWVGLVLLFVYPIQMLRLALKSSLSMKIALPQAFFLTIGKFAEITGQSMFYWRQYSNHQSKIIEYK